jgi:hypothetical protein
MVLGMSTAKPVVGDEYGYHAVAAFYRPRPVGIHFVLTNGSNVVALRVREDFNPRVTTPKPEIWVGETYLQRTWGGRLFDQRESILPLFVMKKGNTRYTYLGEYKVLAPSADATTVEKARTEIRHRYGVSMVISLRRK